MSYNYAIILHNLVLISTGINYQSNLAREIITKSCEVFGSAECDNKSCNDSLNMAIYCKATYPYRNILTDFLLVSVSSFSNDLFLTSFTFFFLDLSGKTNIKNDVTFHLSK